MGLAELPAGERSRKTCWAFAIIAGGAVVSGSTGWGLGELTARGDLSDWADWERGMQLKDLPAFVAAYLHAGGYIGALTGLVLAIVYVRLVLARRRRLRLLPPLESSGDPVAR